MLRKEISWSSYRKVPILLTNVESGYQPLNDSSMIISLLASHFKDNSQKIEELIEYYPNIAMHDADKRLKYEIMNKYFIMYKESPAAGKKMDEIT